MNKQVKGGLLGIKNACDQDDRLEEMAKEYFDIKRNANKVEGNKNRLDGLKIQMDKLHVNKALHQLLPHKDKKEHPEFKSFYEDSSRVPNCSEERKNIFYMLVLRMAAHNDNELNYKPYFDMLFKKVEETKKQEAKNKLINDFGFIIKDEEPEVDYEEPEVTDKGQEGSMFTDVPGEQLTASGGGSRKYKKNLCHKKSVKNPNKCKKVKGCKVANGTKRSYCRKTKNTTKSVKESIKSPIKLKPRPRRSNRLRENKQPLAKFPRIAWKPDKSMYSQNQIDYMKMK